MFKSTTCKLNHNCYNDKRKSYLYRLNYEVSEAENKITKIPRIVKKVVCYLKKVTFCRSRSFLFFGSPSTKFLIDCLLMYIKKKRVWQLGIIVI